MADFWFRLSTLAMYSLSGGVLSLLLFSQHRAASRHASRYAPVYYPQVLPFYMLAFLLLAPFFGPTSFTQLVRVLTAAFAYSALLWAMTPLLRRRISAQGCAALWLLPNLLFFTLIGFRFNIAPLFVVRLTRHTLRIAVIIWASGFAAVLSWKLISHLRFRKAVLKDAVPVPAQERDLFLSTWRGLCLIGDVWPSNFKRNKTASETLEILRSPAVDSPLSIGLLKKTRCLVLPRREYSVDELRLIFRHETIHLLHGDNWLKFTLSFLCAAGWFLPILWLGMGKAAEELELCCDELATDGAEEDRRRAYINLLLSNAGTAKGFTTCLSASASGLRYRMARILHPKKRRAGGLAVLLLSVFSFFLSGMVGISSLGGTVQTELLDRDGGGWHIHMIYGICNNNLTNYMSESFLYSNASASELCKQVEAMLQGLELEELLDYSDDVGAPIFTFHLARRDGYEVGCWVHLFERGLKVYQSGNWPTNERPRIYRFTDPSQLDLERLQALFPPPLY